MGRRSAARRLPCPSLRCSAAAPARLTHTSRLHPVRGADDGKATLLLRATRAIAAGEELTDSYMQGVLHRPDAALFHYGFLPLVRQQTRVHAA